MYWIVHLATDAAQTRAIMLCAQRSVTRSAPIAYHVRIAKLYTFCHRERFEVARAARDAQQEVLNWFNARNGALNSSYNARTIL